MPDQQRNELAEAATRHWHQRMVRRRMATMKNCHSPAGMHFSNAGCRNTTLTDCPGCKYGTLDLVAAKYMPMMKCADCGREYSMEQLRDLRKSPNE
jgi:uncharacterized protein (DUF983 family)